MNADEPKLVNENPLRILIPAEELRIRAFVQMYRAFQRITKKLEGLLDRHGMSTAQFDVLATLRFGEGITQQELAERLLVTKGNVCGLLDRMSVAGWVERRPDPEDRRANRLYLTDQGRALLEETLPEHHQVIERIFGFIKTDDLETLHGIFKRIGDESQL